jgi:hypothetical protein
MKHFKEHAQGYVVIALIMLVFLFQALEKIEERFVPQQEFKGFYNEMEIRNTQTAQNIQEIKELQNEMRNDIKKLIERSVK